MQSIHRAHWGAKAALLFALIIAVFLIHRGLSYSTSLIASDELNEDALTEPGQADLFLGSLAIQPGEDEIIIPGTNNPQLGIALTAPEADLRFLDDGDNIIDSFINEGAEFGFPVIRTADSLLDDSDEVVVAGALTPFIVREAMLNEVGAYVDSNLSGGPDADDDFLSLVSSASQAVDGMALKEIPSNVWVNDGFAGGSPASKFFDPLTSEHQDPTIIIDDNDDGYINEEDYVIRAGVSNVYPLVAENKVCFDGSISDDSEYDFGEVIWWDSAGDCATFDTGVDMVLVEESTPTGTSHLFGAEAEVGAYGANMSASVDYVCSRGDVCNSLTYTGIDGVNWVADDNMTLETVFLTSSSVAVDGVRNAANAWDLINTAWTMYQLNSANWLGNPRYTYQDLNDDDEFSTDEPIFFLTENGGGAVLAGGQIVNVFDETDHYVRLNEGGRGFNANNSALIESADDILDIGALDGSGTDTLIYVGPNVEPNNLSYNLRLLTDEEGVTYYDHNDSGTYEAGDAIIYDEDLNGYYGADDLQSIAFTSAYSIGVEYSDTASADLDNILTDLRIYTQEGACTENSSGTLVGSVDALPIDGTEIAITMDVVNAGDDAVDRTLCIYGDVAEGAPLAGGLRLAVLDGDAQFLSMTNEGDILMNTSYHIAHEINVNVVADPGEVSVANTFTFTYTSDREIPAIAEGDAMLFVVFPVSFNVSGANMVCSVGETAFGGSLMAGAFFGGQAVALMNAGTPDVEMGDVYTCTVTGVVTPSSEAVYTGGYFGLRNEDGADGGQMVIYDQNVSYTLNKSGGGRNPVDLPIIQPPTYAVNIVTPNGGEFIKAGTSYPISWNSNEEVQYVNLSYSTDGGVTYRDIVRGIPNTGAYSWRVPNTPTEQGMLRIQSTDLSVDLNSDESDASFTIVDPNKPFIKWRSPEAGATLQAGTKQWLLWDSSKAVTEVELFFSEDGGVTYGPGSGRKTNFNAYQVDLPDQEVLNAYVKIVGYAPGFDPVTEVVGPIMILKEVDTASLRITSPNTLQAFVVGQKTTITWNTTGEIPLVELQFAPDGKNWTTISPFIPNTGSFEWTIPDVESQYAFVRIGGNSKYNRYITDKSDEPFWIVRTVAPAVTLLSPNDGATFSMGMVTDLVWETVGDLPTINLYMTFANGAKEAIALGVQNNKLYQWTIPEIPVNTVNLLIEGLDRSGKVAAFDTAGPFNFLGPIGFEPEPDPVPGVIDQDPCVLGALRPGAEGCPEEGGDGPGPTTTPNPGPDNGNNGGDGDSPGPTFISPGADGGGSGDSVSIAIFDQTGLDLYRGTVTPRVSVANSTIEFDPSSTIRALVGTNLLVELVADSGNFVYATSDGRTEPFEKDANGLYYAYVPVGLDTTHVKIQSQDLNPQFSLSLRVSPQLPGSVLGLQNPDGSERVVLLQNGTEWNAGPSAQVNPARLAKDNSFAWYAPNGRYAVEVRSAAGVLYSQDLNVRNNIVNPVIQLTPQPVPQVSAVVDFLIPDDVQGVVLSAVSEVRTNETAQTAAAVAVPVSAAVAVTSAVVLTTSFNLLNYLQYLFTSPLFLFARRKKKGYGTVYNAITKAPIPFATIRFYDQDNRIARTVVTDTQGRYALTLPPGKYRPVVVKLGYRFPSEEVSSATDGELENVFTGGFVNVTIANPVVHSHFPVDPDEVAGHIVSLRRAAVLRAAQFIIAFAGLVISAYATFINPSKISVGLLLLQVFIVTISMVLTKVHTGPRTGKVINAKGEPMAGVVVRLFEATYNKLVETQRTDAKGRYNFLVKDGQFYVVAETPKGKVTSQKIDYRGITELKAVAPVLKSS